MAEQLYGLFFPAGYRALVDRVGPGTWGGALFLNGPRELLSSSLYAAGPLRRNRDWAHRRTPRWSRRSSRPPRLPEPDKVPEWPLWPEPGGAVCIGAVNRIDLYLLRHLRTTTWAIGIDSLEGGLREQPGEPAETVLRWLTGAPLLTDLDRVEPIRAVPVFEPRPSVIVVASLAPTDMPLSERVEALSKLIRDKYRRGPLWEATRLRSTRQELRGPQLVSPFALFAPRQADGDSNPVSYASAPWQRLDFNLDGDALAATGWYDDAIDGSGRHQLCIGGDPDRAERGTDLLAELASALNTNITNIEHL